MTRVWSCALALALATACEGMSAPPEPVRAPMASATPPDLSDPAGGMTLRLPPPGASRAEVLALEPECPRDLDPVTHSCTFHGWIRPLSQPCDGGCTWWTYRFEGEQLDAAELERSLWDAGAAQADALTEEGHLVANELTRRLGVSPRIDRLGEWHTVESSPRGTLVLLERRTWSVEDLYVTWLLSGRAEEFPGFIMSVRVERVHPDRLRVEMLEAELTTGEPLMRLSGGPVPEPLDVPLWLTFDERDRIYDNCSIGHEATIFPLPDGRLYVGQYNTLCGGPRQCRIVDPRTGAAEPPTGGCLWGEGIHHRATAIGGGLVLLISDDEGGGAAEIVRYDPARGIEEVCLSLSISATAWFNAVVRDGGVDFSTVCDLPPGCEHREYDQEVPNREYRWTPTEGLVAL